MVNARADVTVDEGSLFTASGSFSDPGADGWSATVNYGDGTATQPLALNPDKTFALNHTYADNGSYTVVVTVTDDDGAWGSDSALVTVNNVAPTVEAGADATIDEGGSVSLAPATFNDKGTLDTHTASIDWGDGSPVESGLVAEAPFGPPGSTSGASGTVVAGTHVYADDGVYTVTVTVTDDDGSVGSDTTTVTVRNLAPTVSAGGPYSVDEGSSVLVSAVGSDPGDDALTYAWDLDGNGSFETPGQTVTFSAAALDGPSVATIRVQATDTGRLSAEAIATVDIVNVAPAMLLSSATVQENGVATLVLEITDPGMADSHLVTINWNDGSPTVVTLDPGVLMYSVSHQYLDDNPTGTPVDVLGVTGTVSDDDEGTGGAGASVTVQNVAPAIDSVTGPTAPLLVGAPAAITVDFSDPGTLDTFTCTFAWNDGSPDASVPVPAGDRSCTANHAYATAGVYSVDVTVIDDDTGEATTTFNYVVVYSGDGFVTGGGWFNSAAGNYQPDPTQSGRANFGYNARNRDGEAEGETEFQFHRDGRMNSTARATTGWSCLGRGRSTPAQARSTATATTRSSSASSTGGRQVPASISSGSRSGRRAAAP